MKIKSSAFQEGGKIPGRYTCDDKDVSPPLFWEDIPENTKSLVLICDDPDAPMGTWVHWVMYNLDPAINELPENVPASEILDNGSIQGKNDFRRIGYGGPCPPGGVHRYYFKLYALDIKLDLGPGLAKSELLRAMEGHILDECQLMGRYSR
jgi:Raf kinase inhibitor-like YbhB/YbcL family protein